MEAAASTARAAEALATINAQNRADLIVRQVQGGLLDAERLAIAIAPLHGRDLTALARALVKALRPVE